MKKLLSLLLAIMMIVSCVPAMADDAEWKINATTQLVGRKSAAEKLESIVVPAEVDGIAVRGIEYMAFNMYKNFKSLTIADSAVMLDRSVLRDLPKLETVDLPESLLVIREGNFTNLPMLTSVVVPASVAVVHSSFSNCKSLTSITFEGMCPAFASAGSYDLFADLPADCVIYVPNNQVHVYKAAFADREDVVARIQPSGKNTPFIDRTVPESDFVFDASTGTITGYTGTASYLLIPASIGDVPVKHIAVDAFFQCHSLCCVIVPEGVETVGAGAFSGIALMSYAKLPSTLVSMGDSVFASSKTYMSVIAFDGTTVPTFTADAFAGFKGDWQLILPYGTDQATVDAFSAYIASASSGVASASLIDPSAFPALDSAAAAPFTGTWNGVAVFDGSDTYGMDLLGMSITTVLNADGTGSLTMDGDAAPGRWYVDNGAAVFAPIYEEGGYPVMEEAIPMPLDENNRMVIDLGGLYLMLELEGATYTTSVFPAEPTEPADPVDPATSANPTEGGEMLLGDWYDDMGNKLTLTDDGAMTFTWAMDGWVDEYTWAVTDGAAVVTSGSWIDCPITLENGILMITDGEGIFQIFSYDGDLSAYYGSNGGYELPEAQPIGDEGAPYFGSWKLISMAGMDAAEFGMEMLLTLNQDGTCTMFDGYSTEPGVWTLVDGAPYVMGSPLSLNAEGNLVMTQEGADMVFARDGEAPAAPVAPVEPAKPAIPALDASADPFIGKWNADTIAMNGEEYPASVMNMTASITLNADGTAQMIMFDRDMFDGDPTFWYVADGQVWVGMDLVNGFMVQPLDDGRLGFDMDGMLTKYVKEGAAAPVGGTEAPAAPAAPAAGGSKINVNDPSTFVGKEFKCVELVQSGVPMDLTYYPASLVVFHDNGMADVTLSGMLQTNQPYVAGNMGGVDTIMVNYMNYTQLMYNVGETGLDLNYMGMMDMHFEAQ